MQRVIIVFTVLTMAGLASGGTHPGKTSLAGALTTGGSAELSLGKMASGTNMYLLNVNLGVSSSSSESEMGGDTADGPKESNLSATLLPEYRTYLRPNDKVSPYYGIYGMLGFGSSKTETTNPTTGDTNEVTGSNLSVGAGVTFGVEYFMSSIFSIAAHSRVAQLSYSSNKSESGAGDTATTMTKTGTSISVGLSAAIYLRIYW